jgi:drug/metabolite transporter (DMT)-like permease
MSAAFDARLGPHAEAPVKPHLHKPMDPRFALGILAVLALGLFYMAYSIRTDIADAGGGPTTIVPFILLGVALLIALGFEFVNGFHDTANAVATVIYTHALPSSRFCRLSSYFRLAPRRATPWCSRCSFPRSSGTWAPGGWASPLRVRTP